MRAKYSSILEHYLVEGQLKKPVSAATRDRLNKEAEANLQFYGEWTTQDGRNRRDQAINDALAEFRELNHKHAIFELKARPFLVYDELELLNEVRLKLQLVASSLRQKLVNP